MTDLKVPEEIGTNTGPPYEPRRGHPVPREVKSQKAQMESSHQTGTSKGFKVSMSEKVRKRD